MAETCPGFFLSDLCGLCVERDFYRLLARPKQVPVHTDPQTRGCIQPYVLNGWLATPTGQLTPVPPIPQ
jgi:hypothetical protein